MINAAGAVLAEIMMERTMDVEAEANNIQRSYPNASPDEKSALFQERLEGRQKLARWTGGAFSGILGGNVATGASLATTATTHNSQIGKPLV